MTTPILAGLREIAGQYDGFIVDLWGVIHDGSTPYPGAIDCLAELRTCGKRVLLLSNSPRRVDSLIAMMQSMGIDRQLYSSIMSSGEAVHDALLRRPDPWFQSLGRRCLHVGPERDAHLFDGLDLIRVARVEDAEFLLNTGPDDVGETLDLYRPLLDQAAAAGLKMLCANPDLVVMHEGQAMLCAGALAAYYEQIGGDVAYRGKPDPAIYVTCFDLLGILDHRRILAIGDAFHTDMAGAARSDLDAVFCSGGIHADELRTRYGVAPDPARLAQLFARFPGLTPRWTMAGLIW